MNTEFEKFIELAGGDKAASEKFENCSLVLIRGIRNGNRDVSKNLARQIIKAFPGEISLSRLLYPDEFRLNKDSDAA